VSPKNTSAIICIFSNSYKIKTKPDYLQVSDNLDANTVIKAINAVQRANVNTTPNPQLFAEYLKQQEFP
jgi:hypothetical protein